MLLFIQRCKCHELRKPPEVWHVFMKLMGSRFHPPCFVAKTTGGGAERENGWQALPFGRAGGGQCARPVPLFLSPF